MESPGKPVADACRRGFWLSLPAWPDSGLNEALPGLEQIEEGVQPPVVGGESADAGAFIRVSIGFMNYPENAVSIHPYFKVNPGSMDQFKAMFPAFVAITAAEEGVIHYEFTVNGDEVFCREAYAGAEAALKHLADVGALLGETAKISKLARLEIHGPAAELDKMRAPLAHLPAAWFTVAAGL